MISNETFEYAVKLRRQLHMYPEIGFDLPKTLAVVRRELDAMGLAYTDKYCRSSLVAVINDDKPFISLEHGQFLLCGAPWSGKHGLDENITVPLQGICILQRGKENRIEPIPAEEALPMLLHQSYCPLAEEKRDRFEALVKKLAEKTPLWRMYCNMDVSAAEVSHGAMSE